MYETMNCKIIYNKHIDEFLLRDKLTNSAYWLKIVNKKIVLKRKIRYGGENK